MGQDTKIEWATHTFNHVRGCTKVSDGCKFCYAETLSHRNPGTLGVWGPNGSRVVAAESAWREPLKWDKAAAKAGERHRVFCASLADVFEDWRGPMVDSKGRFLHTYGGEWPWAPASERQPVAGNFRPLTMNDVRRRLARLIWETQNLDYLLLTKRPENAKQMIYEMWFEDAEWPKNYWLGTSVENQATADERIPHLLATPAAVRFLSVEPLLGPVEFSDVTKRSDAVSQLGKKSLSGIDWVIVGGESGPHARPCDLAWIRSIRDQCKAAGVSCFVKQLGSYPVADVAPPKPPAGRCADLSDIRRFSEARIRLADSKGGDINEFPEDLRVREMPEVAHA